MLVSLEDRCPRRVLRKEHRITPHVDSLYSAATWGRDHDDNIVSVENIYTFLIKTMTL